MCNRVGKKSRPRRTEPAGDKRETFFWQPADVIIPNDGVELYMLTRNQGPAVKTVLGQSAKLRGCEFRLQGPSGAALTPSLTHLFTHREACSKCRSLSKLTVLKNLKCLEKTINTIKYKNIKYKRKRAERATWPLPLEKKKKCFHCHTSRPLSG